LPQTALVNEVGDLIAEKSLDHWETVLADTDCCYHAVLDYAEAARDPHVQQRGMIDKGILFAATVDDTPPPPRAPVRDVDVPTALALWGEA
jgi:crotonobetainyl-CoA:carnitine CoA-transferase CaiB-like acyl-CoA transferase